MVTHKKVLFVFIGCGILFRILTIWSYDFEHGVIFYVTMADSFVHDLRFTMPHGRIFSAEMQPAPSHHYEPLYPLYLALWLFFRPYSPLLVHCASLVLSLAFLIVLYCILKDLYSHEIGLIGTAVFALHGILIDITGKCLSEHSIGIVLIMTLWAAVKALRGRDDYYWVLAGFWAGLGYLSKAKAGTIWLILLIMVLSGFLMLRRKLRISSPHFLAGVLIFIVVSGTWMVRNYICFGTTSPSVHNSQAYAHAVTHPELWLWGIVGYSPVFLALVLVHCLCFGPVWRDISVRTAEHALYLFCFLVLWGSSWIITGAVWTYEGFFFDMNATRYILPALIPLVLFFLAQYRPDARNWRQACDYLLFVVFLSGLLIIVWSFVFPQKEHISSKDIRAVELVNSRITPGDCIMIDPPIHKNHLLYYELRFKDRDSISIYNGKTGKKCRFLVCYSSDKEPETGFSLIGRYFDRVSVWRSD
ncbi:glycosyltransferase family 39 protein [bacterium]|nr:glycosyltransferase family 39 protein [bacterium]